jgi:hypothetical protein
LTEAEKKLAGYKTDTIQNVPGNGSIERDSVKE